MPRTSELFKILRCYQLKTKKIPAYRGILWILLTRPCLEKKNPLPLLDNDLPISESSFWSSTPLEEFPCFPLLLGMLSFSKFRSPPSSSMGPSSGLTRKMTAFIDGVSMETDRQPGCNPHSTTSLCTRDTELSDHESNTCRELTGIPISIMLPGPPPFSSSSSSSSAWIPIWEVSTGAKEPESRSIDSPEAAVRRAAAAAGVAGSASGSTM